MRKKEENLHIRISKEAKQKLRAAADSKNLTVSEYIQSHKFKLK